jgi:diguanylate cyclase
MSGVRNSSSKARRPFSRFGSAERRGWRYFVALIMIAVCTAGIVISNAGVPIERGLRGVRDSVRHHDASGNVVIVEIDAKSLKAIDEWPWPRRNYADVINHLTRAGARSIAFDVDFSSRSNPSDDAALASALDRAGGAVILPVFRQAAGSGSAESVENLPAKMFQSRATLASVNVHPDEDGVIRSYPVGTMIVGIPRPSLAALVAETNGTIGQDFAIDLSVEPNTIPRISFVDLVSGRAPANALSGKRIIIGATAIEVGDRYALPQHGVIPGVVVQAMAAETLIAGTIPVNYGPVPGLILALIGAAVILNQRSSKLRNVITIFALSSTMMIAPLMIEIFTRNSIDVAPGLIMIMLATIISGTNRIIASFRESRFTDAETKLRNINALAATTAREAHVTMALIRITHFGEIASLLGPVGQAELLKRVADRIRLAFHANEVFRADTSSLAVMIKPDIISELENILDGLSTVLQLPIEIAGRKVNVGCDIGIASGQGSELRKISVRAGLAADAAHEQGARWFAFSDRMDDELDRRMTILAELDSALTNDQIWVAYQPKYDVATQAITSAEALVRWRHPVHGNIPPDHFIPVIEAHGRAADLTSHVLAASIADAQNWDQFGFTISVAVNISATLLVDPGFVARVAELLAISGFSPDRLTLEITESAMIKNPENAIQMLVELRALGLRISVDDYGTGQSTLTYLKRLPASEIKIDQSFVKGITGNRSDVILVRSTIEMAHELGFSVVAEGAEDQETFDKLVAMDCDTIQGWFIGRPLSATQFLDDHSHLAKRAA